MGQENKRASHFIHITSYLFIPFHINFMTMTEFSTGIILSVSQASGYEDMMSAVHTKFFSLAFYTHILSRSSPVKSKSKTETCLHGWWMVVAVMKFNPEFTLLHQPPPPSVLHQFKCLFRWQWQRQCNVANAEKFTL